MKKVIFLSNCLIILLLLLPPAVSAQWEKIDADPIFNTGMTNVFNVKGEFIWCGSLSCFYTKDFKERKSIAFLNNNFPFLFNDNLYYTNTAGIHRYEGDGVFTFITPIPNTGSPYYRHLQYENHIVLKSGDLWGKFDGHTFETLHETSAELLHHDDSIIFFAHEKTLVRYNYLTQSADTLNAEIKKNDRVGFSTVLNYHYIPYQDKIAFFEDAPWGKTRVWITDGKQIIKDTLLSSDYADGYFSVHRNQDEEKIHIPRINMEGFFLYKSLVYKQSEAWDLFNTVGWIGIDEEKDEVVFIQKDSKLFEMYYGNKIVGKINGKEIGFGFIEDHGFELFAIENNQQKLIYKSNKGFNGLFHGEAQRVNAISRKVENQIYFFGVHREKGICFYKTDGSEENTGLIANMPEHVDLNKYSANILIHLNDGIGLLLFNHGERLFYKYTGDTEIKDEQEGESGGSFEVGFTHFGFDAYSIKKSSFHKNNKGNVLIKSHEHNHTSNYRFGALVPTKKVAFTYELEWMLQDAYSIVDAKGEILYTVKVSHPQYGDNSQALLNDNDELVLFTYTRDSIRINDSLIVFGGDYGWSAPVHMIKINSSGSILLVKELSIPARHTEINDVYKSNNNTYFLFFEENFQPLLMTFDDKGERLMNFKMRVPELMCENIQENTTYLLHNRRILNNNEVRVQVYSHQYKWIINELRLTDLDTLSPSAMHVKHDRLWIAAFKNRYNQPIHSFLFEYTTRGELLHVYDLNGSVIKSLSDFEKQMIAAYESQDSIGVYTINRIGKITASYSSPNHTPNFTNQVKVFTSEDFKSFYILAELYKQFYWDEKTIRYAKRGNQYAPYTSYMKRPISLIKDIDFISQYNFTFQKSNKLMLYPNPLSTNGNLTIINKDPSFKLKSLDIHNTLGMHMGTYDLQNEVEPIRLKLGALLRPGHFILQLNGMNDEKEIHRLIVY